MDDLNKFHPEDQVVVVDSDSNDKSYMDIIKHPNLEIHDIQNKYWHPGAWWHGVLNTSEVDHYAFMHDSMRIKNNISYIYENPLTFLMYFHIHVNSSFSEWGKIMCAQNNKPFDPKYGCWGPILFLNKDIIESLYTLGVHRFLPKNKPETGHCEGLYGTAAEIMGFCPREISLYGNVLEEEGPNGRSGLPPHRTEWMFPFEKFYSYSHTSDRL
jgi:hypothetical protein